MATGTEIRVAINGYGVIGKRVADAVAKQEDMRVAGIVDVVSDWRPRVALDRGFPYSDPIRSTRKPCARPACTSQERRGLSSKT